MYVMNAITPQQTQEHTPQELLTRLCELLKCDKFDNAVMKQYLASQGLTEEQYIMSLLEPNERVKEEYARPQLSDLLKREQNLLDEAGDPPKSKSFDVPDAVGVEFSAINLNKRQLQWLGAASQRNINQKIDDLSKVLGIHMRSQESKSKYSEYFKKLDTITDLLSYLSSKNNEIYGAKIRSLTSFIGDAGKVIEDLQETYRPMMKQLKENGCTFNYNYENQQDLMAYGMVLTACQPRGAMNQYEAITDNEAQHKEKLLSQSEADIGKISREIPQYFTYGQEDQVLFILQEKTSQLKKQIMQQRYLMNRANLINNVFSNQVQYFMGVGLDELKELGVENPLQNIKNREMFTISATAKKEKEGDEEEEEEEEEKNDNEEESENEYEGEEGDNDNNQRFYVVSCFNEGGTRIIKRFDRNGREIAGVKPQEHN